MSKFPEVIYLHDGQTEITWSESVEHGACRYIRFDQCGGYKTACKAIETKRPYAQPNAQRHSIYTDDKTWEKLVKLGNGNASAGIREAVRKAQENNNDH